MPHIERSRKYFHYLFIRTVFVSNSVAKQLTSDIKFAKTYKNSL